MRRSPLREDRAETVTGSRRLDVVAFGLLLALLLATSYRLIVYSSVRVEPEAIHAPDPG